MILPLLNALSINRLEEMSSDNQRLQLSIEQKNGKIRSLENKYVGKCVNPECDYKGVVDNE